MRHRVKGRHLGRTPEHRKALLRNLVSALFEHGRIRTTDAKAREVRPLAERMISLGKQGSLHARRQALRVVGKGPALERLFGPVAQRFADRPGGYTRIVKGGRRHGDGAPVAYLELLDEAPATLRRPAEDAKKEGPAGKRARSGLGLRRSKSGESAASKRGERKASDRGGPSGSESEAKPRGSPRSSGKSQGSTKSASRQTRRGKEE